MKKFFHVMIGMLCLVLCIGCFAACAPDDGGDNPGGVKTYVMEAEYIDLDGIMGAGLSNEKSGVNMIHGTGLDADKNKGWSNGYYVGFTYSADLTLNFAFESDAAATATIILRLGSELGNITLTPQNFAVKLSGTAITYTNMYITGSSDMEVMSFTDKTVTANASLAAGKNTISLVVLNNAIRNGQTGGPMIDCVKIKTSAALIWADKTNNPGRRGEI